MTIEGYTPKQGENPDPHMQYCTPGLLKTLKVPILMGRDFMDKVTPAPRPKWAL